MQTNLQQREDETEAFADSDELQGEYQYVYAGLTWAEYWASEGVYAAGDTTSSEELDGHKEFDKGAFDTVTRATTNHGLHRGSFQTRDNYRGRGRKQISDRNMGGSRILSS